MTQCEQVRKNIMDIIRTDTKHSIDEWYIQLTAGIVAEAVLNSLGGSADANYQQYLDNCKKSIVDENTRLFNGHIYSLKDLEEKQNDYEFRNKVLEDMLSLYSIEGIFIVYKYLCDSIWR